MKTPAPRIGSPFVTAAGLFWALGVSAGMVVMLNYSNTPGNQPGPPPQWPRDTLLVLDPKMPTLIRFHHPRCPCTRASISELARLMAQGQGRASAQVLFFKPAESPEEWAHSGLWEKAAAVPGVSVACDDGGREAARFHAATSGHTVLFDVEGRLLFSGGITAARGHSGDNAGRSAILSLLEPSSAPPSHTPVFGCSILETDSACQLSPRSDR